MTTAPIGAKTSYFRNPRALVRPSEFYEGSFESSVPFEILQGFCNVNIDLYRGLKNYPFYFLRFLHMSIRPCYIRLVGCVQPQESRRLYI